MTSLMAATGNQSMSQTRSQRRMMLSSLSSTWRTWILPVDIIFVWVPPHEFQMGGETYTKLESDPIKLHFPGPGSIYDSLTIARPDTALPVGVWEVQVYWNSTLLSTAQFTLQPSIEIVGKSRSPTESEPLYAGNTLTVTYQLRNTGKTILKSVRFDVNTPLPRGASLVEATSPKDMSPEVDASICRYAQVRHGRNLRDQNAAVC